LIAHSTIQPFNQSTKKGEGKNEDFWKNVGSIRFEFGLNPGGIFSIITQQAAGN